MYQHLDIRFSIERVHKGGDHHKISDIGGMFFCLTQPIPFGQIQGEDLCQFAFVRFNAEKQDTRVPVPTFFTNRLRF